MKLVSFVVVGNTKNFNEIVEKNPKLGCVVIAEVDCSTHLCSQYSPQFLVGFVFVFLLTLLILISQLSCNTVSCST